MGHLFKDIWAHPRLLFSEDHDIMVRLKITLVSFLRQISQVVLPQFLGHMVKTLLPKIRSRISWQLSFRNYFGPHYWFCSAMLWRMPVSSGSITDKYLMSPSVDCSPTDRGHYVAAAAVRCDDLKRQRAVRNFTIIIILATTAIITCTILLSPFSYDK